MATNDVDALVIFGATGDLAKLETFPALVGLVERGVLDVPVIGVAKSGWGLDEFRDYAKASLRLNGMDPASPAATKLLEPAAVRRRGPRRRQDVRGDVGGDGRGGGRCSTSRCRRLVRADRQGDRHGGPRRRARG